MKSTSTVFGTISAAFLVCVSLLLPLQSVNACPCAEVTVPPGENTFTAAEGLAYMKTPEYKKAAEQAIADAKKACEKHKGEKYVAIVSDIDETCLDNSEYFEKHQNAGWGDWAQWMNSEKAPPLQPTADFLSWARKNGFAVFLITGRTESDRKGTIANLVNAGIAYDGLYLRGNDDNSRAEDMKAKYRKQIEDLGFKIIVSIGDQYSDLAGGHAEDCEKLPNKMYFIK